MKEQSRMLPFVMQAIADLRDASGSSTRRIVEYVTHNIPGQKRRISAEIRKAIKQGLSRGLIKQRSGKYRLGLDSKEFSLYKSIQMLDQGAKKARRGRPRKNRTKSKKRKRSEEESDSETTYEDSQSLSDSEAFTDASEPMDGRKRKRGKSRKRSRKRRSRRRKYKDETSESEPPRKSPSVENKKKEENNTQNQAQCNNPECLCNLNNTEEFKSNSMEFIN